MAAEPLTATCPACGLALPARARFCARCGARLPAAPPRRTAPTWVLVLFWLGCCLALVLAGVYSIALLLPDSLLQTSDPGRIREGAAVVAGGAALLFAVQLAASIGLTAGRPWARVVATLVCVLWGLTCVGLPLAVLALGGIWRPLKSSG